MQFSPMHDFVTNSIMTSDPSVRMALIIIPLPPKPVPPYTNVISRDDVNAITVGADVNFRTRGVHTNPSQQEIDEADRVGHAKVYLFAEHKLTPDAMRVALNHDFPRSHT